MRFVLTVDLDGAAFQPDPGAELARLLRDVALDVEKGPAGSGSYHISRTVVMDENGNRAGSFYFEER